MKKCCCGADMIMVDNHIICGRYYEHIKEGVIKQQEIIEELENGGI